MHLAMQSVLSFLSFTTEVEDDYSDGYIPTLDLQVKMLPDGRIIYKFFKKPMANQHCVMAQAALPEQTKIAVLVQEIVRRNLNTSELEEQKVRDHIMTKFNKTMEISGYDLRQRQEIMTRGLRAYEKLRELARLGRRPLHRRGKDTLKLRFKKKPS